MDQQFINNFLLWGSEAVLGLLVLGMLRIWVVHLRFREEVSDKYARREELHSMFTQNATDMAALKSATEKLIGMVHELKGVMYANRPRD